MTDVRAAERLVVVARITGPGGRAVECVEALTPYAVQTVVDAARAGGRGTRLDVLVRPPAAPGAVADVRALFGALRARGIAVRVRMDSSPTPTAGGSRA